MAAPLVQVRGVSKSYYRDSLEIPVLRNISFDIPEGEFLALMGPSGSGKTTLLNLISGIDQPSGGDLMVAGENIAKPTRESAASGARRPRRRAASACPARPHNSPRGR